ncbi:MAG: CPBP family intramembrane metalloprotease [Clostridia bacterium]|nr:CPBP family intramembrane metalloprotease [Clostridia bacterium]
MDKGNVKNAKLINLSAEEGGVLYSFAVVSALLVSMIFSTVMTMLGTTAEAYESDIIIIINFVLAPIAILLAIGVLRLRRPIPILSAIDVRSFSFLSLISVVLIGLGLMFGLAEVNELFVTALQKAGLKISAPILPKFSAGGVIASILFVCIIPAVVEEFLFRGLLLSSLKGTGTLFAVVISGVIFSLFHMSPAQTIYQFIVGACYALVVLYGKNILYAVGMHLVNNLYIVLNYYFFQIDLSGAGLYIVTAVGLIFLALGIALLLVKGDKPKNSGEGEKVNRNKFIFGALIGIIVTVVMWITALVV